MAWNGASLSPWVSKLEVMDKVPVCLDDVMSQQLADHLVAEDMKETLLDDSADDIGKIVEDQQAYSFDQSIGSLETSNDLMLAKLMQKQFDKEYDDSLHRHEKRLNEGSKVTISYDKFRRNPRALEDSDTSDDDEDLCESVDGRSNKHWDSFEQAERKNSGLTIGKQGVVKQGSNFVSKHDNEICGRRNACRAMAFDISTGDGGGFDMKLNNNVYNALKVHSMAEGKRAARLHEKKEKSTADHVMDENTRLIMFKLINGGMLEVVNGTISVGKEANVYHGIGGDLEQQITMGEVAIKVYKTTLSEFKNRDPYIKDDYRFKDRFSKQNPRKVIHLWAEKEMFNLIRMRRNGLRCPEVIALKKHVLVMTFVGKEGKPARTLKDAKLVGKQLQSAYDQTVDIMQRLYSKCELVHADLSEYNLLWHENQVWVIDVSQSVFKDHPNALRFLLRDCYNMAKFFAKRGLSDALPYSDLFTLISHKTLPHENGIELLSQIEHFEKNEELLAHGMNSKGDPFDAMFKKSVRDNEAKTALSKSK